MKICKKCGTERTLLEFTKNPGNKKDGCRPICRKCANKARKKQYAMNPGPIRESVKKWQHAHPEQERARNKKYREAHRVEMYAKLKKWMAAHPERAKEIRRKADKKWAAANPDKLRAKKIRQNAKVRSTSTGKLNHNISVAIRQALHGEKAGRNWETLVNFTVTQLKKHLEKRFQPGMTWENYGKAWVIDHKMPISVFNFEKPEDFDFRLCWSLKNLQPLEVKENNKKHNKIDKPFQPSLLIGGAL